MTRYRVLALYNKVLLFNPFPPSVPIWHRLAKLSILILEGIIKKFPMSVTTMSR